ncbi:YbbR-like domain-containing protein [Hyunsoonleella flava]|uniref:YbbR-like domain-containing protein n=1 Tax=Hyunsoonleella flava TaxID=2527939 RepID=A0A4Q9FHX6_9FLAO|nr:YbbR-like domain-containing protein [Hyunsoonleella flava]
MKTIKSELLTSIKNKRLNVFLLFLLSAFVILIFTKLSKEYTNTVALNIKKINVPDNEVILKDSTQKLSVTLKTHGFNWLKYYFQSPNVSIDFSNEVYKKQNTYVYTKSVSYLNEKKPFQNNVKLLGINPDTLVFKYDTNLVRKVPIRIEMDISFAPGFDVLNDYATIPDSVTIIGPHEVVESISHIDAEKVSLKQVKTDISQTTTLIFPENSKDLKFSVKEVTFIANVEKFTEGTVTIPVNIINVPQDISIKYFPKEVKVSYYTSLDNFNNIKPNDFRVSCDFNKVDENQFILIPELVKTPEGVKYAKLNQQQIEFIILK